MVISNWTKVNRDRANDADAIAIIKAEIIGAAKPTRGLLSNPLNETTHVNHVI